MGLTKNSSNFFKQKLPIFRLIGWLGVMIIIYSRFFLKPPLSFYLISLGCILALTGLTCMIISYWQMRSKD